MNEETITLKDKADKARSMYKLNLITRSKAIEEIMPYVEAFNRKSVAVAKKYGQRPKLLNIVSYLR